MNNSTMDKIAVGAVFQFGHNRDGKGVRWVKESNRYSRCFEADNCPPQPNGPMTDSDERFAAIEVTYLGSERTMRCSHQNTETFSRGLTGLIRDVYCHDCREYINCIVP